MDVSTQEVSGRRVSLNTLVPKYLQVAQKLLRHIAQHRLTAGQRLGTESEFIQKYGVSRMTLRQAGRRLRSAVLLIVS